MTTQPERAATTVGVAAEVAAEATAAVVGAALGPVSGLVGRLRPQGRSLHPRGQVRRGTLVRHGVAPGVGVPWLDGVGEDEVLVRLSRSAGLPAPWPDVAGLAVRVPLPGGRHADLLMSSAWDHPVGRYLLRPTRRRAAHVTTVFPLRSPSGPLLLGALPADPDGRRLVLRVARPGGPWRVFGELRTSSPDEAAHRAADGAVDGADLPPQDLRFDAVRHPLPGLPAYGWAARLRAPAYAAARRAAGRPGLR